MSNFLQFDFFLQDTGGGETYLQWLMSAWGQTLGISAGAWVIAALFGIAIGICRTLPNKPLVWFGNAWTEIFRNIPILVQIFIWYHVIPSLFLNLRAVPPFLLVIFGLGFFTSARIAEQVKAGIESLSKGQKQAGLALGLTLPQTYRYVLMPMVMRIIIPPLTSESMNIIKNSSVAFAVSILELTMFSLQAGEETSRNIEIFLATTTLYFLSAFVVNRLAKLLESRLRLPGQIGAGT